MAETKRLPLFLPACENMTTVLTIICTHPDYQRQGAATAMVRWGIQRAEELGIPLYLDASPAGRPVYERLGFHYLQDLVFETDKWGGQKDYVLACMIRWLGTGRKLG